jgi:hypothetical protein
MRERVKMAYFHAYSADSVVKDRLWAFIDLAICPKYQESSESASKPAIVSYRENSAFITIKGVLQAFGARQI